MIVLINVYVIRLRDSNWSCLYICSSFLLLGWLVLQWCSRITTVSIQHVCNIKSGVIISTITVHMLVCTYVQQSTDWAIEWLAGEVE